jgi:hypothetical protein
MSGDTRSGAVFPHIRRGAPQQPYEAFNKPVPERPFSEKMRANVRFDHARIQPVKRDPGYREAPSNTIASLPATVFMWA